MRATFATVLVIFLKVSFQKFPYQNYVEVSSRQLRGTLETAF